MTKLDLSLTPEEVEAYLSTERTARVATCDPDGSPQVVPLWFVWVEDQMFLNSTRGNRTVQNALRTGRAAATVDDGWDYGELRGVVVRGWIEEAEGDPRLPAVKETWSAKYFGGNAVPFDRWRNRLWLRLSPDEISSWDFRKIPEARARVSRDR